MARRRPGSAPDGLPAADRDMWERITESVRPLPNDLAREERRFPRVDVRRQATPPPAMRPSAALAAPERASLDGSWDKRVRKGRLSPERTVDLHGHSSDSAYALLMRSVEHAALDGVRTLLVITGKARGPDEAPRGIIAKSLPVWLETPQLRPYIAATRPAHPRHGGNGAVYVILRRAR